jgi:hypothetical protein
MRLSQAEAILRSPCAGGGCEGYVVLKARSVMTLAPRLTLTVMVVLSVLLTCVTLVSIRLCAGQLLFSFAALISPFRSAGRATGD